MPEFDIIVRGGSIADGLGGEPFEGDVGIGGDRIVAVGALANTTAKRVIDASGKLVTPGFIDVHTHYDGQAIWSDRLNPSSNHGVTTVVIGNCGVGFAPCRHEDQAMLVNVMEGVEDIPGIVLTDGLPWTWQTFPEYMDALEDRPRDIDVAALLPHSPLRIYVMGARGARREPPTADDLRRMRALAKEAAEVGAIGFATSSTPAHRTADGNEIPSYQAELEELEAISLGIADGGGRIIQATLNTPTPACNTWPDRLAFIQELVRASGLGCTLTFSAQNEGPEDWRGALAIIDKANNQGMAIRPQVFPRPVGMLLGLDLTTHPFVACPSYQAIAELPLAERVAKMREPAMRARILSETPKGGSTLSERARSWNFMFPFSDPPNYEPPADSSMGARADREGRSADEIAYDHLLEDDGHAMLLATIFNYPNRNLDAVAEIMKDPNAVLGLGDGGAHYGAICDASYPTFTLTHWTRDRAAGRLPLGRAVRALSHTNAEMMGLHDRG
ncbi:MAG: amidohydrolase family protein [Sphingomonas sp.]